MFRTPFVTCSKTFVTQLNLAQFLYLVIWTGFIILQKAREKPRKLGLWSYKIDYTERAGTADTYNVHYNPAREKFFGTLDRLIRPWSVQ